MNYEGVFIVGIAALAILILLVGSLATTEVKLLPATV